MPRLARAARGGEIYHTLNRGNDRKQIFFKDQDYVNFLSLLHQAQKRIPVRIIGYCLMPNHWHLLLWPDGDGDLSRLMHWLCVTHTQRFHRIQNSIGHGHIYQGRYKSFPVETNNYLITVARYIERNALRAGLVKRAEAWRWSSLHQHLNGCLSHEVPRLTPLPIQRPQPWVDYVNQSENKNEVDQLKLSICRGRPFGSDEWVRQTATVMGIAQSLRPRGRPPIEKGS